MAITLEELLNAPSATEPDVYGGYAPASDLDEDLQLTAIIQELASLDRQPYQEQPVDVNNLDPNVGAVGAEQLLQELIAGAVPAQPLPSGREAIAQRIRQGAAQARGRGEIPEFTDQLPELGDVAAGVNPAGNIYISPEDQEVLANTGTFNIPDESINPSASWKHPTYAPTEGASAATNVEDYTNYVAELTSSVQERRNALSEELKPESLAMQEMMREITASAGEINTKADQELELAYKLHDAKVEREYIKRYPQDAALLKQAETKAAALASAATAERSLASAATNRSNIGKSIVPLKPSTVSFAESMGINVESTAQGKDADSLATMKFLKDSETNQTETSNTYFSQGKIIEGRLAAQAIADKVPEAVELADRMQILWDESEKAANAHKDIVKLKKDVRTTADQTAIDLKVKTKARESYIAKTSNLVRNEAVTNLLGTVDADYLNKAGLSPAVSSTLLKIFDKAKTIDQPNDLLKLNNAALEVAAETSSNPRVGLMALSNFLATTYTSDFNRKLGRLGLTLPADYLVNALRSGDL